MPNPGIVTIKTIESTVEFRRLSHCIIDWATDVEGKADRAGLSPSPTTDVAQSMKHRPNLRDFPVLIYLNFNVVKFREVGNSIGFKKAKLSV